MEASGLAGLLARLENDSLCESPPLESGPSDEERLQYEAQLHDEARMAISAEMVKNAF